MSPDGLANLLTEDRNISLKNDQPKPMLANSFYHKSIAVGRHVDRSVWGSC